MSQTSFINVHVFDGKLKGIFKLSREYSIEEKKDTISESISLFKNPSSI